MRLLPFFLTALLTVALVYALDRKWGSIPPLGKFLSPQQGFWQNAEPSGSDHNETLDLPGLKGNVTVHLDERMVPHVFADHDADAYMVQGYLHAKHRLWQMEFQTLAAAGRVSEVLGNNPQFIRYDREMRRMGMVYAAENALEEIESNPVTKEGCNAYTAGVNAYINSLTESTLPLEYKLLDYKPEPWSNLKIALFLKQMSKTLAGYEMDLEQTNARNQLPFEEMMQLDVQVHDSLVPIIPKETVFTAPGIIPTVPETADSAYFFRKDTVPAEQISKPDPLNGSNNWAVSGSKTASGSPILCNDPHLELSFPSIWYEMQISTPSFNSYGASFPGSPNIIIGFNDSIAFGFTNAQRDVKDYYKIWFKDETKSEYWYNGRWEPTKLRVEEICVRGGDKIYDTVAYTVFGPVMYDSDFSNELSGREAIALRWTAHDPSNEGLMWFKLNRAENYDDYLDAIKDFSCPGQNMLFASTSGDIAIWQQAKFPARWYGQGMYVMPGVDSSYQWQGFIPQEENPHILNPSSGFIQSANQRPVDSTYPYFIPGNYIVPRGVAISRALDTMQGITPDHMKTLQNSYYSSFAADMLPVLLQYVEADTLTGAAAKFHSMVSSWNYITNPESNEATIYQLWLDSLEAAVWGDEYAKLPAGFPWPEEQTLFEWIKRDSAFTYVDNINTERRETLEELVTNSLLSVSAVLEEKEKAGTLAWSKHKNPTIYHLLKSALMPFAREVNVGGWSNVINATTHSHGPSWRMIVHLKRPIEAYGVYPGGQSGNPGSKYYDSFVDTWEKGEYYNLWVMRRDEASDPRVKWTMRFRPAS